MHEKNQGNDFFGCNRIKPYEKIKAHRRKKGISENSESPMGIKLMTFYVLDGSLGLEKNFLHVLAL